MRYDDSVVFFLGHYFDEIEAYQAWAGPPPFMRREMGRDWAKDPLAHVGAWPIIGEPLTQPPDIFLVPNGFRCAR